MASCYEDLSETASFRVDDMISDTDLEEGEEIFAIFGDTLHFDPILKYFNGKDSIPITDNEDLTYEWKLTTIPSQHDTTAMVIGHERVLNSVMNMSAPADATYFLFLRVTDNANSIKTLFNWRVKVLSNYGQGLLIAETDDEATTDISLLMATAYNGNFGEIDTLALKRNIYSLANGGSRLDGIVSDLNYASYVWRDRRSIYAVVKDKHFYSVEPISMKIQDQDMDFFHFAPSEFKPKSVESWSGGHVCLNNNGDIHYCEMRNGTKFSFVASDSPFDYSENFNGYSPTLNSTHYSSTFSYFTSFDKASGSFIGQSSRGIKRYKSNTEGKFDPTDIQDRELLYVAAGNNSSYRMLMKSKSSDDYYIYEMAKHEASLTPIGREIYNLSACPDVKNATSFAFARQSNEFYYAVGNEVRVAVLNIETPTPSVSYTVPSGEVISHIALANPKDAGLTTWDEVMDEETGEMKPNWRPSADNLLTVASYDSGKKEGFIRSLPIEYAGAGVIANEKYVKTYGGFGRITAIAWKK